jgi:hypothetical protein
MIYRISPADSAKFVSKHNQVLVTANPLKIKDGQVGMEPSCVVMNLINFFPS